MGKGKMDAPIFIHGILRRSGTNLLNKMILLDPDCHQPSSSVREDWFLPNSPLIYEYADHLFKIWSNPKWGGEPFSRSVFFETMGNGLVEYLKYPSRHQDQKRLVSKTPCVTNLINADDLFPQVKHVIIVRDPLDVAASAYNTWKVPVARTLREWSQACKEIDRYCQHTRTDHTLLRYEDLLNEPMIVFQDLIDHLGLTMNEDIWEKIKEMPLYGSSDGGANWTVTPKTDTFRSTNKWKELPSDQLEQIQTSYDGRFASYFGYAGVLGGAMGPLPSEQERRVMGASLPAISVPAKGRSRRAELKQGIDLIKKALLG